MKRTVLSVLALGAMTTAAAAEPQALSEDRLAGVAAGFASVAQGITQWQQADGFALDLGKGLPVCCIPAIVNGGGATVDIDQNQTAQNNAAVDVTRTAMEVLNGNSGNNGGSDMGAALSTRFNFNQSSN